MVGPFIGLHQFSTSFYGEVSKLLYSNIGEKGIVIFEKVKGNVDINDQDYQLTLINQDAIDQIKQDARASGNQKTKAKVKAKTVFFNFWQYGLIPSALLLALVLAMPMQLTDKLWAGAISLLLIQVFIFFRVYLSILNHFQQIEWLAVYSWSETTNSYLSLLTDKLFYFGSSLIVVVFLWITALALSSNVNDILKKFGLPSSI